MSKGRDLRRAIAFQERFREADTLRQYMVDLLVDECLLTYAERFGCIDESGAPSIQQLFRDISAGKITLVRTKSSDEKQKSTKRKETQGL